MMNSNQRRQNNNNTPDKDYGPYPYVMNVCLATEKNSDFRRAVWTGEKLQMTLMCIEAQQDIGAEMHSDTDQFLFVQSGRGTVRFGESEKKANIVMNIMPDMGIFVPAGMWHNVINTGSMPLKLYSIYAPPHHPRGTVITNKGDSD